MKTAKRYSITLLVVLLSATVYGQTAMDSLSSNIRVNRSYKLDLLQERFNKNDKTKGYRIQLHSGVRSEQARKVKSKFLMKFPEESCYESYKQPYFNVKAGDFMTKLEAQYFLNSIRQEFPTAFIVPDYIDPLQISKTKR